MSRSAGTSRPGMNSQHVCLTSSVMSIKQTAPLSVILIKCSLSSTNTYTMHDIKSMRFLQEIQHGNLGVSMGGRGVIWCDEENKNWFPSCGSGLDKDSHHIEIV